MVSSLLRTTTTKRLSPTLLRSRGYHDESFGYRKPPTFAFPDCAYLLVYPIYSTYPYIDTEAQLQNRHTNAALLRYVDSVRTHAHRAARIDPLDLIHRESEVAALNPGRYGLPVGDPGAKLNVNGIIWTNPEVEEQRSSEEEWMSMEEINRRLREVYVGRIGYEVSSSFPVFLYYLTIVLVHALPIQNRTSLVFPPPRIQLCPRVRIPSS